MSKLILITGGQAVGKMTVGESLKAKTGIPMTMNHDSLDLAAKIYGWGHPAHKLLSESIRKSTFESAIMTNTDLIFTYVWAFNEQEDWEYVENINKLFNGELYIVELVTDLQTRLKRNKTEYRLSVKPSKRNTEASDQELINSQDKYRLISNEKEVEQVYKNYIKIENTKLSPEEVSDIIIERFNLSNQLDSIRKK